MATALDKANSDLSFFTKSTRQNSMSGARQRAAASSLFGGGQFGSLFGVNESTTDYDRFSGWSYVAINAIAKRAARQNPRMARSEFSVDKSATFTKEFNARPGCRAAPLLCAHTKSMIFNRRFTAPHIKGRADNANVVMIDQHPLLDAIMHPNDIMTKWALIYVTIASMELTGRAYWWFYKSKATDESEQELFIWPIPSNWMTPVSSPEGIHTKYKVRPPNSTQSFEIDAKEIAPFVLPDPANPTQSISPLRTQIKSVRLDELIQTAQMTSMDQGIFPGVILTAGRLPDMPGGIQGQRPVLTRDQRQDIITAIRGAYQGVRNFNEPFIVDGLIEDVKPFTNKPVEMAFRESGENVKSRIFGAFGLNPIVIGEIAGANRAQATVAEENFISCVVNPLLELIGEVLTFWIGRNKILADMGSHKDVFMWIEPAEAHDADISIAQWRLGLRFSAVYRNEFRSQVLGLPPKDEFESVPPVKGAGDDGTNAGEGGDGEGNENNGTPTGGVSDTSRED